CAASPPDRAARAGKPRPSLFGPRPEQDTLVAEWVFGFRHRASKVRARELPRVGRRRDFASSLRMRSISPARPMRASRHWSTVRAMIERAWQLLKLHWL